MNNWGSIILDFASNIYWVVGIFIFFTLLLHLLFVLWFPLSPRTWKFVDYLWLSLALLSTLGLVGNAKQYRAENAHFESEWHAAQSLNDVRGWYINYQILICAEAKTLKEKNLNDTKYHALCDWLEKRINDLNLMQRGTENYPVLTPSLTRGLKEYSTIISSLEQKILDRRIAIYNDKRAINMENVEEGQRTTVQMIIIIMAPVMLAFALAIRFTKVTAEFRFLPPGRKDL